jgi:murein DD-endopeptidase MepM/ murein hydrolase activator NlpD
MRLMLAAGAAALMAGCSDANRFSDPFSDPFSSGTAQKVARRPVDRAPTGSIGTPGASADAAGPASLPGRVESRPLPGTTVPVAGAQPSAPRAPAPVASAPASSGGAGGSHWTADGGTPITVGSGETAAMLATRYGVPTDALLRANGYANAAQVQPGARLIIPVYRAGAVASAAPAPAAAPRAIEAPASAKTAAAVKPEAKPDPKAAAAEKAKAEREAKLAREEEAKAKKAEVLAHEQEAKRLKKAEADKAAEEARAASAQKAADAKKLAEAKQLEAKKAAEAKAAEAKLAAEKAKLAKADAAKAKADGVAKAEAAKAAKEAKLAQAEAARAAQAEKQAKAEEAAAAKAEKQAKVAAAEKPAEPARPAEKTVAAAEKVSAPAEEATKVSTSDPDRPEFRWPARGRIIQGFSSGGNDGINIAVPEGTPVKAAEGGQVAYAGSELKGYGNLVLIRHPNGFVTAYAHNGELDVKRGDTVKRGQTIAKSGQSGNVGSPQLHFELRKGATPVDPTSYLAGL